MSNLPRRKGWKKWLPRTLRQLNKREQLLMALGVIWIAIGLSTFETAGSRPGVLLHEQMPSSLRGSIWIFSGALAIFAAWRPPGVRDTFGWAVLYIAPTVRVVSYTLAWLESWPWLGLDSLLYTQPYADAWRFAIIYLAQSLTIVICAGWPNPIEIPVDEGEAADDG